ncbi:uncharacterized protein KZ484_025481 [Pholidichthys leucotaenia]
MRIFMCLVFVLSALSAEGNIFFAKVGETVTMVCKLKASLILKWSHGTNMMFNVNTKRGSQSKGTGEIVQRSKVKHDVNLEISKVKEADAGGFKCEADGKIEEFILAIVSVSITPSNVLQLGKSAQLQCQVKGLDQGAEVRWERPDGHSQKNIVEIPSVSVSDKGTWKCIVNYAGKTFNENVTITVKELSQQSIPTLKSQTLEIIKQPTSVTRNPSSQDSSVLLVLLEFPLWVWLAFGAGCLVVILLIICVIILCKRMRRRKRKFLKMKNAQNQLKPKTYCQCDHPTAAPKPRQGRRREKPSALPL